MRKYIAATLSIVVAIGPASALDVGLGGKAGGVGIGANVSVGSKGASVGVGVGAGQTGGAKAGASAGRSNGSVGAKVGGSGKAGSVAIGASAAAGSKGASLGVGANVDGVGDATAGTSIGRSGASLGIGANIDGVGGATAGTSIGKGGTGLGIGGNIGSASSRESDGVRAGSGSPVDIGAGSASGNTTSRTSAASANATRGMGAALGNTARGAPAGSESPRAAGNVATTVISTIASVRHPIILPPILRPSRNGRDKSGQRTVGYPMLLPARLRAVPGAPGPVVRACRKAIASAAKPLGAVRVQAESAGPLRRHRRGALSAPIEVRIDYARQGGIDVRQARVRCRLDATGRVIAVT